MPRRRRLRRVGYRVRLLPPARLRRNDRSQPRDRWLLHPVRDVPRHDEVGRRSIQSQPHGLPADRGARRAGMPELPHRWRLRRPSTQCASCHRAELQRDDGSGSCGGRLPDELPDLPQHDAVGRGHLQPLQTQLPADGMHTFARVRRLPRRRGLRRRTTECFSCHQADFNGTTNPNHVSAGFPTIAQTCHTTSGGRGPPSTTQTIFPLTGAHTSADCSSCHTGGRLPGDLTRCAIPATRPTTTGPRIPITSAPGSPTTAAPVTPRQRLAGSHLQPLRSLPADRRLTSASDCSTCHSGGVYQGLTTLCYACHQADYNGTTNPNHAQRRVPRPAAPVTTRAWAGADFNTTRLASR